MSALQQHIIAKQTLDIELFGLESEGLALQKALPQLLHESVNLAIENVLNQYSQVNDYISIDYLELNLEAIALERLESVLAQRVEESLTRALREKVARPELRVQSSHYDERGLSAGVKVQTYPQTVYAAWVYFLRNGRLPWAFKLAENKGLEDVILENWQMFASSHNMQAEIKTLLNLEVVRQRLIYQFSGGFLLRLLTSLLPSSEPAIVKVAALLQRLEIAATDKKILHDYFWQLLMRAAIAEELLSTEIVLKRIAEQIIANAKVKAMSLDSINQMAELFIEHDIELLYLDEAKSNAELVQHAASALKTQVASVLQQSLNQEAKSLDEKETLVAEPIYIDFAGLVLLHPFFPQFFKTLGLVEDDEIVQQSRAVCLLHYLSTGQTNPAEHDLVLAKILCGIPLAHPVEMEFTPTKAELEQVESLLTAVISHWQALKNTSIDGLRGTFLIRAGKLSLKEGGDWQLQVESQGFDILMSSLPWSISMIQLPWMRQMLWVEWAT